MELYPLQQFAREVYRMLFAYGGRLILTAFEIEYQRLVGKPVNPNDYGYQSVSQLLSAVGHVVIVHEHRGYNKVLELNPNLAGNYFVWSCNYMVSLELACVQVKLDNLYSFNHSHYRKVCHTNAQRATLNCIYVFLI